MGGGGSVTSHRDDVMILQLNPIQFNDGVVVVLRSSEVFKCIGL